MTDLDTLSNSELIELWDSLARELSYHNAAEGHAWFEESLARAKVRGEFRMVDVELHSRGLRRPAGEFLL